PSDTTLPRSPRDEVTGALLGSTIDSADHTLKRNSTTFRSRIASVAREARQSRPAASVCTFTVPQMFAGSSCSTTAPETTPDSILDPSRPVPHLGTRRQPQGAVPHQRGRLASPQ